MFSLSTNKAFKSPKLRAFYSFIIFFLIVFTIFRLAFLIFFKASITPDTEGAILKSLWMGFRFDLRFTMILLLPAIVIANLKIRDMVKTKIFNSFYFLIIFLLILLYFLDIGHFAYLKTRINATFLQVLQDPIIGLEMVRESYPVFWVLLLLIGLFAILFFFFSKMVTKKIVMGKEKSSMKLKMMKGGIFTLVVLLGLYGSVRAYPLRWVEAFHTTDNFCSNLGLNPILYIADTYSFRHKEYDKEEAFKYYDIVADFFKLDESARVNKSFVRNYDGDVVKASQKTNVVIIIMESMGWYKTGLSRSPLNPTPHFDKLAKESILFPNFYTPTIATARSIFATITSLPDTSKIKSSSRNPFYVNQHSIFGEFKHYDKFYFIGGNANWGNIRGVLSNNVSNLKIFEEGSYKSKVVDVWGISDLDLFKEAHSHLNENLTAKLENNPNPFFAIIQTAGFHRPYTIPEERDDFKVLTDSDISEDKLRQYGFDSLKEYNSIRFQDYALSKFMELAKKESWYHNTIFVVYGDHSLPHNNAEHLPPWRQGLVNSHHVPMIIHYPREFSPRVENRVASELDILATVAGLTGTPYHTRSFGRDLFNEKFDDYRAAFLYNINGPYNIGLIDSDFYFEYIPGQNIGKLIKYSESVDDVDVKLQYKEQFEKMKTLSHGLYETGKYLLNHNPKIN